MIKIYATNFKQYHSSMYYLYKNILFLLNCYIFCVFSIRIQLSVGTMLVTIKLKQPVQWIQKESTNREIPRQKLTLESGSSLLEKISSKEDDEEASTTVLRVRIFLGFLEGWRGKKAKEVEGRRRGGREEGRERGENERMEASVAINDDHAPLPLPSSLFPHY